MPHVPVMTPEEGAAWEIQLDAMTRVLAEVKNKAAEQGDTHVTAMINSLDDALTVARLIAARTAAPVRKGVKLTKA